MAAQQRRANLLTTGVILIICGLELTSADRYHSAAEGYNLRSQNVVKVANSKTNRFFGEDDARVDHSSDRQRNLQMDTLPRSGMEALGNGNDPFFDSENAYIGPFEADQELDGGVESRTAYKGSTIPPQHFGNYLNDLVDGVTEDRSLPSNSSKVNSTTTVSGEIEVLQTQTPTELPVASFPTKRPTMGPTTQQPVASFPTKRPTMGPTTQQPVTSFPTKRLTMGPSTSDPTKSPTQAPTPIATANAASDTIPPSTAPPSKLSMPPSTAPPSKLSMPPSTAAPSKLSMPPSTAAPSKLSMPPSTAAPSKLSMPPSTAAPSKLSMPPSTAAPSKLSMPPSTVPPSKMSVPPYSTAPPSKISVLSAKEAGNSIVSGVNENLSQGKKGGVKGASSSSSSEGSLSKGVKGVKGSSSDDSYWAAPTKAKEGKNSKEGAYASSSYTSKSKKSKSNGGISSAFEAGTGGKGAKKSKASKYGGGSVSSAYEAGSGGGKGGKGKSKSAYGSGDFVAPGSVSSGMETPAPNSADSTSNPGTTPTSPVSSAVQGPASSPNYPPNRETPLVDCDAIRAGVVSTEGDRRYFQVQSDWALDSNANFDTVSAGVREYLQSEVAPAVSGCDRRRSRRQLQFISPSALITNVLFGIPSSDGEGSCVIDQVNRCFATEGDVNIYFDGPDTNLGESLLASLQDAQLTVDGLLGVSNLKVIDSNGNEVGGGNSPSGGGGNGDGNNGGSTSGGGGSSSGNDSGSDVVTGNIVNGSQSGGGADNVDSLTDVDEADQGVSRWSKTLIGLAASAAFVGTILCFACCRHRRSRTANDDRSSQGGGKFDFEPITSTPPRRDEGEPTPNEATTVGAVFDDRFNRTWPTNDEQSVNSEEDTELDGGIQVNFHGDTHVCNSAYCEVCAQNGTPRIQFISSEGPDELPEDATRNYHVSDTVKL